MQNVIDKIRVVLLVGDWNTKVGNEQGGEKRPGVVGHHELHVERSGNGVHFVELCANNSNNNNKDDRKHPWVPPEIHTRNQIDFVAMCGKFGRSVLDTRTAIFEPLTDYIYEISVDSEITELLLFLIKNVLYKNFVFDILVA